MRPTMPILASVLTSMLVLFPSLAGNASTPEHGRAGQIRARLTHANQWRDHVMVVAHRAGWKDHGRVVRAENSLDAIDAAVALGVEAVELDVRRSADGVLVVLHDATLERTTTCQGKVSVLTLAELKTCRLLIEGERRVTAESVPTLAEMLAHAKGRILVNIDNKLEAADLPEIASLARSLGVADGILLKHAIWNEQRLTETQTALAGIGADVAFMPILADDAVRDAGFMAKVTAAFDAPAAELIVWQREAGLPMTEAGGPLFSAEAQVAALKGGWHMWINTYSITDRPEGMVAGGRGDGLAFAGGRPDDVYGFWIARGATIIQTDEPRALIDWLEANGHRLPYGLTQ